jgi:hypothetical protein
MVAEARILQQQEQPNTIPQEPLTNEVNTTLTNQSENEFHNVPSREVPLVTSASEAFSAGSGIQYFRPEDSIQIPGQLPTNNDNNNNNNNNSRETRPPEEPLPTPSSSSTAGALISLLQPNNILPLPSLNETQLANIPTLQKMRQGIATVTYQRSVNNFDGVNMNCGTGYLNDYFKDHFVGVSLPMYRNGEVCGACVQLYCVDALCDFPLVANRTFMVVDSCKECQANDVVISAGGSIALSGVNYNDNPSIQVAWTPVSCAPLLSGGIRMLPSKKNSPVFISINFSNFKVLLQCVSISGIPMKRTDYGSWKIDTPERNIPLVPPYAVQMTGVTGQVLTIRVPALVPQDLGVNFD